MSNKSMTVAAATNTSTTASTAAAIDQAAVSSAAASSLQLLLREDPLLVQYGLTESSNNVNNSSPDEVAFSYAAALLQQDDDDDVDDDHDDIGGSSSGNKHAAGAANRSSSALIMEKRADNALQDVERKLALVESLAVKLSRTSPESVAGHLLRLHGHHIIQDVGGQSQQGAAAGAATGGGVVTLQSVRERADRLQRQSQVLETVAKRVEGSLQRGLDSMETACTRLQRVLHLSSTLKHILRLQFENCKLQNYDLEDVRDLIRAAASVAVLEDLLARGEFLQPPPTISHLQDENATIVVVEQLRPKALQTAALVRKAADELLQQHYQQHNNTTGVISMQQTQLGSTLQVFYHLGELPQAVWKAVDHAHGQAEAISRQLWNPVALQNLQEQARLQANKELSSSSSSSRNIMVMKRLQQLRIEAAEQWATGIADAALQVKNLQRVLQFKTDPISRQVFIDVVARAPIPRAYQVIKNNSTSTSNNASSSRNSSSHAKTTTTTTTAASTTSEFSLFSLFWHRFCRSLGTIVESVMSHDHGKLIPDVAALYPAARGVSKDLISRLLETSSLPASATATYEDVGVVAAAGILGGSSILDDAFLEWDNGNVNGNTNITPLSALDNHNPQEAAMTTTMTTTITADSWTTRAPEAAVLIAAQSSRFLSASSAAALSAVLQSTEWKALQGTENDPRTGFFPLQQAFVKACTERLCEPLQYMFPENVAMDDAGVPISSGLSLLPSKYDVQRFDENIRQELSLADPREGGGDLTMVTMIAGCVTDMISQFCSRAKNAVSGILHEDSYLNEDWSLTESLQHDRKVAAIMYTMASYLRNAPEKTFITPYRPAALPQHEEAAEMCRVALTPALDCIEEMVQSVILRPLCRAVNRRVATTMAKMHLGVYMKSGGGGGNMEDDSPAFVQKYLAPVYEEIAQKILPKFPPAYASSIASSVAAFSIYTFVSNAALVRPLAESARLHITQDLADLELSLEQLVMKGGGGSVVLSQIDKGKPYAELRAVRQMLFWSGLESQNREAVELAKSLLREAWIKDVRPSTVIHYLFSFAPSLLSSPYHSKRIKAEDYVMTLVQLDGSAQYGEDNAWMVTMSCCDMYQQRASSSMASSLGTAAGGGDARIAQILLSLGPELLRRRRS